MTQDLQPDSSSVCLRSQGKLVKYFSRQLSCKRKVALEERSGELEDFPCLGHWFRIVNLRKEVTQVTLDCFRAQSSFRIVVFKASKAAQ